MCTESSSRFVISDDAGLDSVFATAEIMADESLMSDLRESIEEMNRGDTVAWEAVKKQMGL